MSVIIEKRRLMARLEELERRVIAEKQRLGAELNELETGLYGPRAGSESRRPSSAAGRLGAFPRFAILAAAAVVAGAALAGNAILRGQNPERFDVAAQAELTKPADSKAGEKKTAALTVAPPGPSHGTAPLASGDSSTQPMPAALEPLPPPAAAAARAPQSTTDPAPATKRANEDGDLNHVSARGEIAQTKEPTFDVAPPVDLKAETEPVQPTIEAEKDPETAARKSVANCFVKVGGRVLFERKCAVLRTEETKVNFELEKPVSLTLDHGKTWTATLDGRALGRVFHRGQCWGGKQVYICAFGLAARS
ncbi:hypothetical protein [Methylocystis sp. ATCC 49242]|uniref:hypothetical protein n=1 Tax=Methylocystis sp. ATCC 49242 TaxID=622637 RepID=UPI0001F888BD|nr:hypothetical protein [Methylocystis sp. ATCC 49242]